MARGKASQSVNARLRRQLQEADEARRKLEYRLVEAERERDAAIARMQDALDNGHPELREAVARERHREEEARRLVAESERYRDYLRDTLRQPIEKLIKSVPVETAFLTPEFTSLMHELFGADFYGWMSNLPEWSGRQDRRSQASLSSAEIERRIRAHSNRDVPRGQKGLQAVEEARQRRLAREQPYEMGSLLE